MLEHNNGHFLESFWICSGQCRSMHNFKTENKDGKKVRLMIVTLYFDDMVVAINEKSMLE